MSEQHAAPVRYKSGAGSADMQTVDLNMQDLDHVRPLACCKPIAVVFCSSTSACSPATKSAIMQHGIHLHAIQSQQIFTTAVPCSCS